MLVAVKMFVARVSEELGCKNLNLLLRLGAVFIPIAWWGRRVFTTGVEGRLSYDVTRIFRCTCPYSLVHADHARRHLRRLCTFLRLN